MKRPNKKKLSKFNTKFLLYPKQAYSCINCGKCCSVWDVPVTRQEKEYVESLVIPGFDMTRSDLFALNKKDGLYRVNKQADGRCVFLDENNFCEIHKHHGEASKPLACRVYPFDFFMWADDKVSALMRYDCPAVVASKGKDIIEHRESICSICTELERSGKCYAIGYNDALQPELKRIRIINNAYIKIFEDSSIPLHIRFYAAARLLEFLEHPEKAVEVLEADNSFVQEAHDFVKRSIGDLQNVIDSSKGLNINQRVTLRYLLSGYARVDEEVSQTRFVFGRVARTCAVVKFIVGKGNLKNLSSSYPDTQNIDPVMALCEAEFTENAMEPYFDFLFTKLYTLSFCGVPALKFSYQHGLRHLLLSYPVSCMLSALYAKSAGRKGVERQDVEKALMIVDHTFIRSPFFRLNHIMNMTTNLCSAFQYPAILKCINYPT